MDQNCPESQTITPLKFEKKYFLRNLWIHIIGPSGFSTFLTRAGDYNTRPQYNSWTLGWCWLWSEVLYSNFRRGHFQCLAHLFLRMGIICYQKLFYGPFFVCKTNLELGTFEGLMGGGLWVCWALWCRVRVWRGVMKVFGFCVTVLWQIFQNIMRSIV